jgi:hypothetical protein
MRRRTVADRRERSSIQRSANASREPAGAIGIALALVGASLSARPRRAGDRIPRLTGAIKARAIFGVRSSPDEEAGEPLKWLSPLLPPVSFTSDHRPVPEVEYLTQLVAA